MICPSCTSAARLTKVGFREIPQPAILQTNPTNWGIRQFLTADSTRYYWVLLTGEIRLGSNPFTNSIRSELYND